MTVSSSNLPSFALYTYTGPGAYSFNFRVFAQTELLVIHIETDGVETELVLTTEYTVSLNADGTGSITTLAGAAGGSTTGKINIRQNIPITQETDWVNNDPFDMDTLESDIDKLTLLVSQMNDLSAFRLPYDSALPGGVEVEVEALKLLQWNATADKIQVVSASSVTGDILGWVVTNPADNQLIMYKSAQWINQTVHAAYQLYNPRTNNPLAFTVHGASLSGDMDMDEFVEFVNKTPLTPGAYIDVAFTQEDILISDPAGFPHIHKPGVLITLTGSYNFGTGVGTILKRTGAAGGALFSIRGGEWIIQGVKLDSTDCSPCFQALDAKIKLGNNPGAQGPLNVFLSGGASGTGGRLLDIENSYVWGKWNRFENVGASADWLLHANHNCYVDMQRTEFWNTGSGNCVEIIRGSHADVAISDFNGKVAGPAGVALRCTNNCWASSGASTMDNFANGNIVNGLRDYINAFNITYTNVTTQNNITTDTMDATGNFINT